jgi:hypothetical protein
MALEIGYYNLLQKPIYGLIIIGCIFLIAFYKDRTLELQSKRYIFLAGLIGFIFASLALIFPDTVPEFPGNITLSIYVFTFFQQFAFAYNICFLIFFGILFIITGFKNREKHGIYLQLAGLLHTITYGLIIVTPFIGSYFSFRLPHEFYIIFLDTLKTLREIIGLVGSTFLLLFGIFNKQKFLILAGVFFLSSFNYVIFTGLQGIQLHS